jgi:hypothetical protein
MNVIKPKLHPSQASAGDARDPTLRRLARVATVVLMAMALVHDPNGATDGRAEAPRTTRKSVSPADTAKAKTAKRADPCAPPLPIPAAEMREAILSAARSGRIDELRGPIELNEMRPESGAPAGTDAIAFWRALDPARDGAQVLAIAITLLESEPACLPFGRDIENNRLFVWPALSERKPADWTGDDAALIARIASADEIAKMRLAGGYDGWRMIIGADGVWHAFAKSDQARFHIETQREPK